MNRVFQFAVAVALCAATGLPVRASDAVQTTGQVFQSDGKTPLANATVAIVDEKGKVIANAKTDVDGRYTLHVPRGAFHLPEHKGGNFLGGVGKALSTVAQVAAPLAAGLAGGGAAAGLAESALSHVAGAAHPPGAVIATPEDAVRHIPQASRDRIHQQGISDSMLAQALKQGPLDLLNNFGKSRDEFVDNPPDPKSPGALTIRVSRTDYSELDNVNQVYWMQDVREEEKGKDRKITAATLDPILLSKPDEGKVSRIDRKRMQFSAGTPTPTLIEFGQKLSVKARFSVPDEQKSEIVVIARNSKSGEIYELTPSADGIYAAEIEVDKRFQKDEQTISILAYRSDAEKPGRSKKVEEALEHAGHWKLDKAYEYNPLLVASRNRLDLRLTVVEATKP
jgi:hypothetical protein